VPPSVVVTAHATDQVARARRAEEGVAVITLPETRWKRVDIKTVGLLANVLAKQAAREAGAFEAWFVDAGGHVTEGSSSNAWIVTADGRVVTRHADRAILRGIARTVVVDAAAAEKVAVEERAFSVAEALAAAEAFVTSATANVTPVVRIDGKTVGNGKPGPVTRRLQAAFARHAELSDPRSRPAGGAKLEGDGAEDSRQTVAAAV
jgi:D-alanine transaminase